MGLADVVRSGIATINSVTADLQSDVSHEAWASQDSYSKPTYGAVVFRQGIVEEGERPHRLPTGDVIAVKAYIAFLFPVSVNSRDRFTTESGVVGRIVDIKGGVVDSGTGATYMKELWFA